MMVEYGLQNVEIDHRIDNDKVKTSGKAGGMKKP